MASGTLRCHVVAPSETNVSLVVEYDTKDPEAVIWHSPELSDLVQRSDRVELIGNDDIWVLKSREY